MPACHWISFNSSEIAECCCRVLSDYTIVDKKITNY